MLPSTQLLHFHLTPLRGVKSQHLILLKVLKSKQFCDSNQWWDFVFERDLPHRLKLSVECAFSGYLQHFRFSRSPRLMKNHVLLYRGLELARYIFLENIFFEKNMCFLNWISSFYIVTVLKPNNLLKYYMGNIDLKLTWYSFPPLMLDAEQCSQSFWLKGILYRVQSFHYNYDKAACFQTLLMNINWE